MRPSPEAPFKILTVSYAHLMVAISRGSKELGILEVCHGPTSSENVSCFLRVTKGHDKPEHSREVNLRNLHAASLPAMPTTESCVVPGLADPQSMLDEFCGSKPPVFLVPSTAPISMSSLLRIPTLEYICAMLAKPCGRTSLASSTTSSTDTSATLGLVWPSVLQAQPKFANCC